MTSEASPDPITVQVDIGSATSWGRPESESYLIRIHRGSDYVIVATGVNKNLAERRADDLRALLA